MSISLKPLLAALPESNIRNKLIFLALSFLLITVALVFALLYSQQSHLLKTQWAESMAAQARLLATNSEAAVAFRDKREANRLLASLASNPAVDAGWNMLAEEKPLAVYQRSLQAPLPPPNTKQAYQFLENHLVIREPILLNGQGQPAAYIVLLVSLEQYKQTMRQTVGGTITLLIFALAAALLLTRYVVGKITAPLEKLDQLVKRISRDGGLDQRLTINTRDEIASLSRGFNQMLDSLQARDVELANHRNTLEKRVNERTQALQEAIAEAHEANRAKSDFLARMSHEIRTPMNAITGLSRMVLETPLAPQQREYLEQVMQASDALLGIINDILDYSKIEAGGLTLESVPFEPGKLFQSVSNMFKAKTRAQGLELHFSIADNVPKSVQGDSLRLGQVLINLVSNAIKFTAEGEIEVSVRCAAPLPESRIKLEFSVRDSGIGIPLPQQDKLFMPFSQADSTITRRFGGTGLGLAICRQLVGLMGGEIWLDSAPGQGSTFTFTSIFILPTEIAPSLVNQQNVAVNTKKEGIFPRWAGERILLVEDIAINRTIAVALLQRAGLHVSVATNGQEALDMLLKEDFQLVLMDIQMPVMDGLSATRAIRNDPRWADLPIIAMTAHAMAEDRQQTHEAGMNAHVTKPIVPNVLYETLALWLPPIAQKSAEPTLPAAEATPLPGDWPELPGIDLQCGLFLHLNRPELYEKSLRSFRHDFADTTARIRAALARGSPQEARRLTHSLKSVAGSLGASKLAEQARAMEHAFLNKTGDTTLEIRLRELAEEIQRVVNGLASLPQLTSPNNKELPTSNGDELGSLFDQLSIYLREADARCDATFSRLRNLLLDSLPTNTIHEPILTEIALLIDDVEYQSALEKVQALRLSMEAHTP